jgi:intein/homing endonuclease
VSIKQFRRQQETALKAGEIVKSTFPTDKRTAKFVVLAGSKDTPRGWRLTTLTKEKGKRARMHVVQVQVPRGYVGKFRACPKVSIDCDCLSGNTEVLTDKGWRTMFSLAADWQPGDPLTVSYVVDGKTYRGSTPFYKGMQPTWKVMLSNGASLKATKDHRVRVIQNKGNLKWVRSWKTVGNLVAGDKVVVTNNRSLLPEPTRSVAFKEAYFLGFWYGDGAFCSSVLPDLQVPAGRKRKSMKRIIDLGIVKEEVLMSNDITRLKFNIRAIEIMARFGISPRTRHSIPKAILDDPELVLGFVSGLLDADGKRIAGGGLSISGSHELIKLRDALIRFGVAHVRFLPPKEGSRDAVGSRTNFGVRTRDLCELKISPEAFRTLGNRLWLVRKPELRANSRRKKPYAKVTSVAYAGRDHVYDIYVEKVHRFVANTAVVHNCERHLFVWNYALGVHGAAIKDRTNGDEPVETNPGMQPGCCKHSLVALKSLIAVNPSFPERRVTATTHARVGKAVNLTTLRQALKR